MTTAKTVQDVILGEAGGSTPQERYQDNQGEFEGDALQQHGVYWANVLMQAGF